MATEQEIEQRIREAMNDRYQGRYQEALDKFDAVIRDLALNGERWAQLRVGEAIHQLGATHQNRGISPEAKPHDFPAALSYLWIAIAFRTAINDAIGVAYSTFQIPMCRLARGDKKKDVLLDFERAEKTILKAIPELERANIVGAFDVGALGEIHQNLAYISQQEGKIENALRLYEQTLDFRRAASDKRGEGLTYARMAECYLELGNRILPKHYANAAMKIFQELGDANRIKQVEAVLAKIQEKEKK